MSQKSELLQWIKNQAKQPLKDATAVNATRWALYHQLRLGLPKTHWLDVTCVGDINNLKIITNNPLIIKAKGHGTRRLCRINKYDFPISCARQKYHHGWQTGDIAKIVKNGISYTGKVVVQSATRLESKSGWTENWRSTKSV